MRSSPIRCIRMLLLACSVGSALVVAADVNSLPPPTGYVDDFAHVVDDASKAELENYCTQVDHQLGVQFALVTVDTIGDTPIRDFALDLGRKWKIGYKNTNQGALLLIAVKDHKTDIEVERELEPYVTDGFAGTTLRAMRPDLRAGQFGAALKQAAVAMATQVAQGKNMSFTGQLTLPPPPVREEPQRERHSGGSGISIIVILFILFWLLGRGRRGGGGGGFLTGMLLGGLLGGGRSGGGWGDGGGFGGGGGGGGFGGFGGGGDFGGGGASSGW